MKTQKKKTWIWISLTAVVLGILITIFTLWKFNKYFLELSVLENTVTLEYGVDEMPEITALCKGTLLLRKGIPVETTMIGEVDLQKLGSYDVTFEATYRGMTLSEKRTIVVRDSLAPKIELVSDPEHFTNPAHSYEEEGFTATDNYDGDVTAMVTWEEHDGVVTYTVTDSSGNTATIDRTIIYKDVIPPVITLTSGTDIAVNIGKDFVDPGFVATDECDGDISATVTKEGAVDGHTYGTYFITYRVTDSSGNTSEVKRTVKVADISAPTIKLSGETRSYIKVGTSYSEPGFTASDNIDGDVTAKVAVSGSVDTSKMGTNTITYSVSDAFGNTSSVTRTVFVYEKQAIANPINPGNKVVYLTFDDGPSGHTATLLDILDNFGVKATFFVTNQFPRYQHMIGETYRRGHTIALHTYSHKYNEVYASEDAYYADLAKINDIVVGQTGVAPTIVRFPGGTNNTVSRSYCRGIMSSLVNSISYHGYFYCDWNVSSGDAGGAKTADQVAANVISGIQRNNVSVVLQHDITPFSVKAVEQILFWGIQNGYTFLPMTETTPMVHFRPAN